MAKGKNGKPSKKDLPTEIKVKYVAADGEHALPTTGAMGQVHPDGESITVHFFYEHNTLPDVTIHPVDDNGIASLREGREEKDSFVTRTIHSTMLLSPFAARRIGEWLIEKSEQSAEVANRIKQKEEEDENNSDT